MWSTSFTEKFFDYPEQIVELATKVKYKQIDITPGYRSEPLELIYPDLCKYVTTKTLSSYYDIRNIKLDLFTETHFQKIPFEMGEGIIHNDLGTITSITYLTKGITDCGTSIFARKENYIDSSSCREAQDKRKEVYSRETKPPEEWNKLLEINNSMYREVLRASGEYNSNITFTSYFPHKMNMNEKYKEGTRLTLIQFIQGDNMPYSTLDRFELTRAWSGL